MLNIFKTRIGQKIKTVCHLIVSEKVEKYNLADAQQKFGYFLRNASKAKKKKSLT